MFVDKYDVNKLNCSSYYVMDIYLVRILRK